jgi:hypothetical protein
MLTGISHLIAQSDQHRQDLLADAESFRLARIARRGRRDRARLAATRPDPPEPTGTCAPAPRNDDAERRYAVPR